MRLRSAVLPLLVAGALAAGEAPAPKGGGPGGADAGRKDAAAAFARQAAAAPRPEGGAPAIIGAYVWGGRADGSYRPFFQWEFRIQSGDAALAGLRLRVLTIGPRKEVLHSGPWQDLGSLAAGARQDASVRLNCPNFPVYRVELAWNGGETAFLAADKTQVPLSISGLAELPVLVSADPNYEYEARGQVATVTWNLWNLGGKPATGVVQTLSFRDEQGKEVHRCEYRPEQGVVPAGYCKEQKTLVKGVPRFANVGVATRQSETAAAAADGFTGAKDIELAGLRLDGKGDKARLAGRVRNGLESAQEGVVLEVRLLDGAGKLLRKVEIPVGRLAPGDERPVQAPGAGLPAWTSYDFSWKAVVAPAP